MRLCCKEFGSAAGRNQRTSKLGAALANGSLHINEQANIYLGDLSGGTACAYLGSSVIGRSRLCDRSRMSPMSERKMPRMK